MRTTPWALGVTFLVISARAVEHLCGKLPLEPVDISFLATVLAIGLVFSILRDFQELTGKNNGEDRRGDET